MVEERLLAKQATAKSHTKQSGFLLSWHGFHKQCLQCDRQFKNAQTVNKHTAKHNHGTHKETRFQLEHYTEKNGRKISSFLS